ncbi:MFS transporter, OFA family, oxalate/formate antiporter [Thermanaeromonas toyohensis ToBE]|uniref:MFS transporter, OFA family, oxalate/formate antiporter n=1 Tax=Thermanaeromonas toyohensis ToBE TaxID=698762 RepID=A0A1W1VZ91_9FIRM|nr:oxalate/formate MFS antiporter [Thermanaeromonas toyohensis]SMB98677.1 MFS transporter, OFA family, oxalate/formate antiporter [Thermanaeromonas toyohensis ToBE]
MEPQVVKSYDAREAYGPLLGNRWFQLVAAIVGMIMIANLQYAWTLFVPELQKAFGWSLAAVQLGFTLFIAFESWPQPFEGYLLDRFGPKLFFTISGLMVGIGWTALGFVKSLPALYFFYAMAGLGAGFVYGGSIAVAVRWFPDRRGLASGLIAAGFGAGSAPFIPVIGAILKSQGYVAAFLYTGVLQGLIILIVAQVLRYPPWEQRHDVHKTKTATGATTGQRGFAPWEMILTPHFWLIYIMFVFMATSGLLFTAQTKPFAKAVGIGSEFVILAVTFDRISNGLSRIMWGWISDKIGREITMFIAFLLNAVVVALVPIIGHNPWVFVALAFFLMLTWGEIFALFPAATADRFGTTYAASNYGVVYSAKGVGGILGGVVAAWLATLKGWTPVFFTAASLSFLAALGALILRTMPKPVLPGAKITPTELSKGA